MRFNPYIISYCFLLPYLFFIYGNECYSQLDKSVLSSNGAYVKSGVSELHFTVGEVVLGNSSIENQSITLGFNVFPLLYIVGIEMERNFAIYPNPVRNRFTIRSVKAIHDLKIFTLSGVHVNVTEQVETPEGLEVDIAHLSSGLYMLIINGQMFRLIKIN